MIENLGGNIRINKHYYLHFGKDIFIKYKLIDVDLERNIATLERVEDGYMGCSKFEECSIFKLMNKRKIYNF